jgi:radical SAM protein with 4Fe4S-binding SPASM domain
VKKGGDTDLFVLLACGASANAHKDQLVRDTEIQHALTDYRSVLDFTEQYHTVLLDCLDTLVVDPRIGRVGGRGLYHQPLECVLEYSGLSMAADRVVNKSIDGNKIKRVMIPNSPRGAWYWRHQWLQGPQFGCHNQDCTNTEQKGDTMVQGSLFQMLMQATLDQAPMISQGGKIPQGGIRSMFNPNGPAVQHIMSTGQQGSFPEQPQNSAPVVFKKCARCQYAKYCSRACQKRHWKAGHQHECKKPVVRPKEFYSW